jgi:hypothetical protein
MSTAVILRCEADDAFASLASLEGWCSAQWVRPSFEARKKERVPA